MTARIQEFEARERLIVALDFPTAKLALDQVDRLEGQALWFKVGLQLYLAAGNAVIRELRNRGLKVFLDLKLHDIPNTVAWAVRSASAQGPQLLTLHAAGGPAMLAAAAEAVASLPDAPRLLAVTLLTSMDQAQLATIGVPGTIADQVMRLTGLARAAGIDGMVCSTEELASLRQRFGAEAAGGPVLVIPGIRPTGAPVGDQARIATPADAIAAGASMLVVGRPITQHADPAAACAAILAEMSTAIDRTLLVPSHS